jgi:hypothetical protein
MEVRRQILPFPRLWHSRGGWRWRGGPPHAAEKAHADHLGLLMREGINPDCLSCVTCQQMVPLPVAPSDTGAVGYGRKLVMVEGLAVCDWTVGQASAGRGKQSHPPLLRNALAGEGGKGDFSRTLEPWGRRASKAALHHPHPHPRCIVTAILLPARPTNWQT